MRPIDADKLNLYLCELQMANLGADDDYCETLNEVIHIVDEQPTIEAKPVVHGEWVHDINNLYGCSVCGGRETQRSWRLKPFCPNCGADMRERKET